MKKCRHCNRSFEPTHGNQAYCSPEHKDFQKAANQYKIYGLVKEFRNGFLGNYKLFEAILPDSGSKTLPLSELIFQGFKHNCYYRRTENERKQIYYWVAEYSFSLYSEKAVQYIKIFKK